MAEKTYLQAISDGLRQEMQRDERVFVIGEDVGVYGGAFKVTLGFQEEFGPWRVLDSPLSETAIMGACTGAAIMGMRPVAEMQFADFVSCAWDHLVTVAAKQRWRAGTPSLHTPAAVRRRLLRRAVPLAEPGVLLRAHPGAEVRLPGDASGRLCGGPATRWPGTEGFPGDGVPGDHGLALVGDAQGGDVAGPGTVARRAGRGGWPPLGFQISSASCSTQPDWGKCCVNSR